MAKTKTTAKSSSRKNKIQHLHINFTNKNYMIVGLGIAVILLGYIFMSANSVDGFLPATVAPILLVAGYCVIVPFGILYTEKTKSEEPITFSNAEAVNSNATSVNVRTN